MRKFTSSEALQAFFLTRYGPQPPRLLSVATNVAPRSTAYAGTIYRYSDGSTVVAYNGAFSYREPQP